MDETYTNIVHDVKLYVPTQMQNDKWTLYPQLLASYVNNIHYEQRTHSKVIDSNNKKLKGKTLRNNNNNNQKSKRKR